ncbi:MAG: hypothetical protein ABI904_05660 [Chloroflexota bacterium]
MNYSLLVVMACAFSVVIAAVAALVILLLNPSLGKSMNARTVRITSQLTHTKWLRWLLPIGIALILMFWTIAGALFFLAVVWLLRTNPGSDTSFTVSNNDKKTAQRVYTWLFFSSIITVPVFLTAASNLSYNSATTNEKVFAALIPLVLHAPLLFGLTSKNTFVYRHTQQGLLLIALRAGIANLALNIGHYPSDGIGIFIFGNGALWLFGSIVGWNQINNNKCWFMNRKGEKIILPEAAIQTDQSKVTSADQSLNEMIKSLDAPDMTTARQKAMYAFRSGTPETRQRAVAVLSQLGEVEKF